MKIPSHIFSFCYTCSNLLIEKTSYPYIGSLWLPHHVYHLLFSSLCFLLYSGSEYSTVCTSILHHWFNVVGFLSYLWWWLCYMLFIYHLFIFIFVFAHYLLSLVIIILLFIIILWLSEIIYSFIPCRGLHILAHCPIPCSIFLLELYALCLIISELISHMTWFCQ